MAGYELIDTLIVTLSVVTVDTTVLVYRTKDPAEGSRLLRVIDDPISS